MLLPPHKYIIDFTADIEHIVDNASPEFQSIIFLGDMNGRNKEYLVDGKTTIEERALKSIFDTLHFDEFIHEPLYNKTSCARLHEF